MLQLGLVWVTLVSPGSGFSQFGFSPSSGFSQSSDLLVGCLLLAAWWGCCARGVVFAYGVGVAGSLFEFLLCAYGVGVAGPG